MYSREDRLQAVELYIKYDKCAADVIRELGYPASRKSIYAWYKEYLQEMETGAYVDPHERMRKYTIEQKQAVVDYYLEHGRSLSRTRKAMGYPCKQVLTEWIEELAPGMRKANNSLQCSYEQKRAAVVDLCARKKSAKEIASKHSVDRDTLYRWKKKLLGKEACVSGNKIPEELPDDIDELKAIASSLRDDIHRLKLEVDILEGTAELLKKDRSVDPASLSNKEKTILIGALRQTYPLKILLDTLGMAKSSFFYQKEAMAAPDKRTRVKNRIVELFHENEGKYGYRPIHAALKQEGKTISEKVVRSIMAEEHLEVRRKASKKYSSYAGEPTSAPDNIVARDFHAECPNKKWLTDISEFAIPAGKVYLSPIIDCFDGMVVSWTIGTSPNAEMANSMLRNAVSTLSENEKPLVHSDRGGHYRWPEWIRIMDEAGLTRSMSKKGCSPDNSACEGFFGRTKLEFFYGRDWRGVTIETFIGMLDEHLHWFNERRIKKSLGWMSPINYRKSLGLAA